MNVSKFSCSFLPAANKFFELSRSVCGWRRFISTWIISIFPPSTYRSGRGVGADHGTSPAIEDAVLAAIAGHDFTTPLQIVSLLIILIIVLAKIRSEGQRIRQAEAHAGQRENSLVP